MLTTVAAGRVYDFSYCIGMYRFSPARDFGLPRISSWDRTAEFMC